MTDEKLEELVRDYLSTDMNLRSGSMWFQSHVMDHLEAPGDLDRFVEAIRARL
jgi:hypothetical protein